MTETKTLNKPQFVKVADLEKHRSGFNVYVKVVSTEPKVIETHDGQKIPMVNCVLADETGSVNAFFKGEHANLIQKDSVVAIRNGLKRYIKDHISLEVDLFGRITLEKDVTVTPGQGALNISDAEHKLERRDNRRPRQNFRRPRRDQDRPPRKEGDRPPRRDREERPRREGEDRPRRDREDRPRREGEDRPRRDREERPRREGEDRPRKDREERPRREGEDRPRKEIEDKPKREDRTTNNKRQQRPIRDNRQDRQQRSYRRQNRGYDRDYDRRDRTENRERKQYRPRYTEKREERGERKPLVWTRIADISPADEGLNLNVQIVSLVKVGSGSKPTKYRCVLGDSTGIANAFLPYKIQLREGDHVVLFNIKAEVVQQHIELQLEYKGGRIELSRRPIDKVSEEFNLSGKAWVPVE